MFLKNHSILINDAPPNTLWGGSPPQKHFVLEILKEFFFLHKNKAILYFVVLLSMSVIEHIYLPHIISKTVYDMQRKSSELKASFTMLLLAFAYMHLANYIMDTIDAYLLPKILNFIRLKIFKKILSNYQENYREVKIGELMTKIGDLASYCCDMLIIMRNSLIKKGVLIIGVFIYFMIINRTIGQLTGVIIVTYYLIVRLLGRPCYNQAFLSEQQIGKTMEGIQDTMANLITVYLEGQVDKESDRMYNQSLIQEKHLSNFYTCFSKLRAALAVHIVASFTALVYTNYNLFKSGAIPLNYFMSIFWLSVNLSDEFYNYTNDIKIVMYNTSVLNHIDEYIKELEKEVAHPSIKKGAVKNSRKQLYFNNISLQNISLKYPNSHNFSLDNLSLEINKGDRLGIFGRIGSGKSTMVKAIVRLLPIETGTIKIDGVNVNEIDLDYLRSNVSFIPQHPKLFDRKIIDNIRYGLKVSDKEILNLIKKLKIADVFGGINKVLHKDAGKNGSNVSGGQRQIIALLRMFLHNRPIIIMDEPTASLDKKTIGHFHRLLKILTRRKNNILIVVSHDHSLKKYFNKLVTMDNGKIKSIK